MYDRRFTYKTLPIDFDVNRHINEIPMEFRSRRTCEGKTLRTLAETPSIKPPSTLKTDKRKKNPNNRTRDNLDSESLPFKVKSISLTNDNEEPTDFPDALEQARTVCS